MPKTLIELYDERAIENILGPETFKPRKVIYLCPPEVARDRKKYEVLEHFFKARKLTIKIEFVESSQYKADHILKQLEDIYAEHKDLALDVTGGTDAALFAAGMFCRENGVPAFTYSRKKNRFYAICNADFADNIPCQLNYRVEEFFNMAGGTMRKGRVDNNILGKYMDKYDSFFELFLAHRREWPEFVTYMIKISQPHGDEPIKLKIHGPYETKGERGTRIRANEALLKGMESIGFLKKLNISRGESVSFEFQDLQVRAWLRDVGSVLELYMYKACIDTGIYKDVVSSAIVDWDGTMDHASVSNEIDVVATKGVTPAFISCKACDVKTEAINELAILRDRFGGKGAKAVIATTEHCNAAARHRAAQLGIAVIDLEELEAKKAAARLRVIMKVDKILE